MIKPIKEELDYIDDEAVKTTILVDNLSRAVREKLKTDVELTIDDVRSDGTVILKSYPLDRSAMGVFRTVFDELKVEGFISPVAGADEQWGRLLFRWNYLDGGRNGADLCDFWVVDGEINKIRFFDKKRY